jgi:hypothetical protein
MKYWTVGTDGTPPASPKHFSQEGYTCRPDLEAIESHREPRHLRLGRGRRFYGDTLPAGLNDTWSDTSGESEDLDIIEPGDLAAVEAYRPIIDIFAVADVIRFDKPEGQQCTVCREDHFYSHGHGRTVKLHTCGHYFHLECIRDRLNGTSVNRSLCPECRIRFSEQRRTVRTIQPQVVIPAVGAATNAGPSPPSEGNSAPEQTHDDFEIFESEDTRPVFQDEAYYDPVPDHDDHIDPEIFGYAGEEVRDALPVWGDFTDDEDEDDDVVPRYRNRYRYQEREARMARMRALVGEVTSCKLNNDDSDDDDESEIRHNQEREARRARLHALSKQARQSKLGH